jgi:uncharacterized membrane protein YdjX (TVP38/TMEM64 family)
MNKINKQKIMEIVWFAILVFLFLSSIKLIKSGQLQETLESFGIFAPIVLVLLKAVTLVIAPLGGTPIYIIAGALYGKYIGLALALFGDVLGSSICFGLSRKYGARILGTFAGSQNTSKILDTVSVLNSTRSFIKARLGFISLPELLAYATGLSSISFWTFSFINFLFYLPVDFGLVFAGSKFVDISTKYIFIYPLILFIFAFVGFVSLYSDAKMAKGN